MFSPLPQRVAFFGMLMEPMVMVPFCEDSTALSSIPPPLILILPLVQPDILACEALAMVRLPSTAIF